MIKVHFIALGRWHLRTWTSVINRIPTFRPWEKPLIRHNSCQVPKVRKSSWLKWILTRGEREISQADRVVVDLEWIRMGPLNWVLEIATRIWAKRIIMKWTRLAKFLSLSKAQEGTKGPQPWVPTTSRILWPTHLRPLTSQGASLLSMISSRRISRWTQSPAVWNLKDLYKGCPILNRFDITRSIWPP